MKRAIIGGALLVAFGLFPSSAAALNITQVFCFAASNPDGEGESDGKGPAVDHGQRSISGSSGHHPPQIAYLSI